MSRTPPLFLMLSLFVGCHRSAATVTPSADAAVSTGVFGTDAEDPADSGIPLPTIEQVEAILRTSFADRIPRTPEDDRVVSFVDKYLDQMKRPFPRPRMFLINERGGDAWTVGVLDLEHLRNGGSGGDISVHVSEKRGKLAVRDVTVGGY